MADGWEGWPGLGWKCEGREGGSSGEGEGREGEPGRDRDGRE